MTLINTESEHKIAKEFFKDYINGTAVSRKIYPDAFSETKSSRLKNVGFVSNCMAKWNKANYFDIENKIINKTNFKGKTYPQKIPKYRLNLDPFFEYSNEILRDQQFTSIEKKIISFIFSFKETRLLACSKMSLFDGIISFLSRIFIYKELLEVDLIGIDFLNGFLVKNKKYLKKFKEREEQFKEFQRMVTKYGDLLINKIRIISHADMSSFEMLKLPIKKYGVIPSVIPNYYSKSQKDELLKRWEIVFYENRELTNDELLRFRFAN